MKLIASSLAVLLALVSNTALAQNAQQGKLKAQSCVMCHGELGISQVPNAPHLAGQPAIYLVQQLKDLRSGKRPSDVMTFLAKPLTDNDIQDLAAWYSSIVIRTESPP
jgi:cytochrome c553